MKICNTVGCPNPTPGRAAYCALHARKPWPGAEARKAARRSEISDYRWNALRAYVLRRDNWTCAVCGGAATEVDHVVPVFEGGRSEPSNLRAICRPCHLRKSSREGLRARRNE